MGRLLWGLALILLFQAEAATQAEPPSAPLRRALLESSRAISLEGRSLLRAAQGPGPEVRTLCQDARRLIEQAARMAAAAGELSVQPEQAALSVRRECAALAELAGAMRERGGRHPEVARCLTAEVERLRRSVRDLPVAKQPEPFEGLATGLSPI